MDRMKTECINAQEENDNDISASLNFMLSPTFQIPPLLINSEDQQQYDLSSLQHQIPDHIINGFSTYSPDQVIPLNGTPLPPVYKDECLPSFSYNGNLDPSSPSCPFIDANVGQFFTGNLNTGFPSDGSCMFPGSLLMGSELQGQDLDFQGDNDGFYSPQSVQQGGNSTLTSEISNLEESTFKVGRLSVEERKEKIHRYMKKRNERNFSKKIKTCCPSYTIRINSSDFVPSKEQSQVSRRMQRFLDGALDGKKGEESKDAPTHTNLVAETSSAYSKEKNDEDQNVNILSRQIDDVVNGMFPSDVQLLKASVKHIIIQTKKDKLIEKSEDILYSSNILFHIAAALNRSKLADQSAKRSEVLPQSVAKKLACSISQNKGFSGLSVTASNGHLNFCSAKRQFYG
ncbi:hypothetical protein GIB67_009085 [Kingdonia uniflora]|uniref:Uncharacterized protein n=1 Tax=Kingdonia uniflora TaxID=39325 RepID=A0A7J7MNN1_9MAGN|nr:hypothetical protein GIB67_009085 [Kingdonia uniflora]